MFADDVKCFEEIFIAIDKGQLQHDLDVINDWS